LETEQQYTEEQHSRDFDSNRIPLQNHVAKQSEMLINFNNDESL